MKKILIFTFIYLIASFATAKTLTSSESNHWNNAFTEKMNQMMPSIHKEMEKKYGECVAISTGKCLGFFENVTLVDGTKHVKFSGMCSLGGDHCDINTDAGWQVMVQGLDDKFNFIKIIRTYKEI